MCARARACVCVRLRVCASHLLHIRCPVLHHVSVQISIQFSNGLIPFNEHLCAVQQHTDVTRRTIWHCRQRGGHDRHVSMD